ncbi:MAG: nucleoside monophosphate kinase [Parcubacteria group bacterium]|nr:nucleoside monophosphate kinase [Parcubacteria group bacterium]
MAKPTLILMGSAGSGKGTQSVNLVQQYGYHHVETGGIIRAKAQEDSPLGRKVKENDDKGKHASDELMTELLLDYLREVPLDQPLLLDGYPRTLPQAALLDGVLRQVNRDPAETRAIWFKVPAETARHRLLNRGVCTVCKTVYPSRAIDRCKSCGGEVLPRVYDTPTGIEERLSFFAEHTLPVIEQYRREGRLIEINAEAVPGEVWQALHDAINRL